MFSFLKRGSKVEGLTGIEIGPQYFSLVHVVHTADQRPAMRVCEYREVDDSTMIPDAIANAVAEFGLQGAECVCVMRPETYSMRLVDDPEVRGEEMREAVRFNLTDLVDFDVEDAVVDAFTLPDHRSGASARSVYAVAAESSEVQRVVDMLDESGLQIKAIDIAELALRNVASLLPEDTEGMAMLSIRADSGLVTLTREGHLCLSRNIEAGMTQLQDIGGDDSFGEKQSLSAEGQETLDSLLLEVQRSLDYYEHQLGQGRAQNLIIAPLMWDIPTLTTYLSQNLSIKIRSLELGEIFEWNQDVARDLQSRCLPAIGAALRSVETKA